MKTQLIKAFVHIANSTFPKRNINELRQEKYPLVDVDYFIKLNGRGYISDTPINEVANVALNNVIAVEILQSLKADPPNPKILEGLIANGCADTVDLLEALSEMDIEDNELLRFIDSLGLLTGARFNYEADFSFRKYRESMKLEVVNGRKLTVPETIKLLAASIDLGLIRAKKEEDSEIAFVFAIDAKHFSKLRSLCLEEMDS